MSSAASTLSLEIGSKEWKDLRKKCIQAIPGKYSALYFLNAKILGHEPLCPMTVSAHYSMCMFAEGATGIPEIDQARVRLIQVPRGFGKSLNVTKGLAVQELLKYDDWSIGIANEKQGNAEAFLQMVKLEFETNELLAALFPERIPGDLRKTTWASDRIVIPRKKPRPTSPSVLAAGVGATVTGVHLDHWICDDLISQNAAENALRGSFSEIESTNRWLSRLEPLLCSPKRDKITIIGTPWWQGDTYEYMEEFWGHGEPKQEFLWTLKLPTGETQTMNLYRVGELAIFRRPAIENGRSIFPERWTLPELEVISQQDPVFYAANYLLEPTAGAASEFQPSWLNHYDWDGSQIRYRDAMGRIKYTTPKDLVCFMSVDPAISDSHSAARSAIPVCATNGDEIFLLEDWAEKGYGIFDLSHKIVDFYLRYSPRYIFIETVVYQRALLEALQQVARERGCPQLMSAVQEIRSHGKQSKDFRIYGLEPYFKSGRFYTHRSHQNFLQEYNSFPRGALRDVLDSISFQKDAWERIAATGGVSSQRREHEARDKEAMNRMLRSIGKGGGY